MYKKVTKWVILSLVRHLQYATKVVRCGRAFLPHMYTTAAKLRGMHYFTRLDVQFCLDLCWWHTLFTEWDMISLLRWDDNWITDHHVQTDTSESCGCHAFWDGQ